jgi:UDP-N-acetylglucosamine acyltransferase
MAVGHPAKPHSVNSEGLKRRGFSAAQIRNIRNAFRTLYRRSLPLEEAVAELKTQAASQPELTALVDFIAGSTRGLIR